MMEFDGREELVMSSEDFFEENKENFLHFCEKLAKCELGLNLKQIRRVMENVYDSFLIKEPNFNGLKDDIQAIFAFRDDFARYLITRSFLHLFSLYMQEKSSKHHLHFINALDRMLTHINNEPVDNDEDDEEETSEQNTNFVDSIFNSPSSLSVKHNDILDFFEKIYELNEDISFLNLYKDVPIKSKGKIIAMDDETITCQLELMQILAIMEEKNAFTLKSDHLPNFTKSDVLKFDLLNLTIQLGNFSTLDAMPASRRMHPRVHPNVTTIVTLTNESGESARGLLYDISNGGLGVLATDTLGCSSGNKIKAEFELELPEWEEHLKVTQDLEVVILLNNNGTYRFCMKDTKEADEKIKEFTKHRELDTQKDLEECIHKYI